MRITYDRETDAMYIRLVDGEIECRTVQLNTEVALNLGPEEQLVGIEILDASEVLKTDGQPVLALNGLTVVAA
jgi:uncharacterized protein YuzE